MNLLSDEWIDRLGPFVLPYERKRFKLKPKKGEKFLFTRAVISVAHRKSINPVLNSAADILALDPPMQGKYLWVIDEQGLKLLLESTPNPRAERGVVCHTNITGGKKALQGGELWFGDDGKVYLNYRSGRYGAGVGEESTPHKIAVLDFFRSLNFDPVNLDGGL